MGAFCKVVLDTLALNSYDTRDTVHRCQSNHQYHRWKTIRRSLCLSKSQTLPFFPSASLLKTSTPPTPTHASLLHGLAPITDWLMCPPPHHHTHTLRTAPADTLTRSISLSSFWSASSVGLGVEAWPATLCFCVPPGGLQQVADIPPSLATSLSPS